MVMTMDNGKMNQQGLLEYGPVMRQRNPLLCTMAHTAFYLFYRWNIAGEARPCFRRRQQWYGLHLVKGEHAGEEDVVRHAARLDQQNVRRRQRNVVEKDSRRAARRAPNTQS
jgi:hypothetical protein